MILYWDAWNREHATSHGVSQEEATFVVRNVSPPYPERGGGGKYRVWGRTAQGRLIQVVFTYTSTDRMDYEEMTYDDILKLESDDRPCIYIIHARDLTPSEKRNLNRRRQ